MGSCPQLQDLGTSLIELWNLMDTPSEEQELFQHITCNIAATEEDVTAPGSLTLDIIDQVHVHSLFLFHLQVSLLSSMELHFRIECASSDNWRCTLG